MMTRWSTWRMRIHVFRNYKLKLLLTSPVPSVKTTTINQNCPNWMKLWTSKLKRTFWSKKHWMTKPLLYSNCQKPATIKIMSWISSRKKTMKSERRISDTNKRRTLPFSWRRDSLEVWNPRSKRLGDCRMSFPELLGASPNLRRKEKRCRRCWTREMIACEYYRKQSMRRLNRWMTYRMRRTSEISLSKRWWPISTPWSWKRCRS